MISSLHQWLGRHPKACLAPVALLAALTGAELLAATYGEAFLPATFTLLAGLWLILATLAMLAVSLAWWVRMRIANMLASVYEHAEAARSTLERMWPRPSWNGHTQQAMPRVIIHTSHEYRGRPVGTHAPRGVIRQIDDAFDKMTAEFTEEPEDTTGDVLKP